MLPGHGLGTVDAAALDRGQRQPDRASAGIGGAEQDGRVPRVTGGGERARSRWPAVAAAVLRPDDLVVVYAEAADGRDAVEFARELRRRGLRRTFHLDGGLAAWRSAGGGVEGQAP